MRIALLIFTLLLGNQLFGQNRETHHRVRIDLTNHAISEVSILGLETDHGQISIGKHLVNDFSESEILLLREAGIPYRIEIEDVSTWYKTQAAAHIHDHGDEGARVTHCDEGGGSGGTYDYETPTNYQAGTMAGYFTYEEFLENIDAMAAQYPNLISAKAEISDIRTHEDRPIYWLRMSDNPNMDEDEPEILYTALHHAREVNSLSQLIFFMWYALENYETDPEIKFILDETELYFIPMVNPDGYVINQTEDPDGGGLWRKNAYRDDNNDLKGVDLNRNYGYEWGYDNQGSSPNPNSQTYRGTEGFSEPETQATKFFCEAHEFVIALNYHTYGNLLIHPWGYEDGPTAEDETFKALGRAMNSENSFFLGTGTETVGYTVNGDSDDWMYGENVTKNAIYTLTPEVGPGFFGFWPPSAETDQLNKSTVRMNLNTALLAHNLLFVSDESPTLFVGTDQKLDLRLKHAGLDAGSNTITVTTNSAIVLSVGASHVSNLSHLGEELIEVPFTVDPNISTPEEVIFTIAVDNGVSTTTQELTKIISPVLPVVLSEEPINTDENFEGNGEWGLTDEDFYSATTCFTDSPGDDYENDRKDYVVYKNAFDLSESIQATLKFRAKWDIEDNYDFVQIFVGTSPVFSSMTPQCGLYTDPPSGDQDASGEVYDGNQPEWIEESINLEDFVGQNEVYVAFSFESDGFVGGDGFYFDDLIVEHITDIDVADEDLSLSNELVVLPNPTADIFTINLGNGFNNKSDLKYQIVDLFGRVIQSGSLENKQTISLTENAAGTYQVIVFDGALKLGVKKVIKI